MVAEWLDKWVPQAFGDGFAAGAAAGLVVVLCLWLLGSICVRWRCRFLRVRGDNGDLLIRVNALRDFVLWILCSEFQEVLLRSVKLKRWAGRYSLMVMAHAVPGTNCRALRQRMADRILAEAADKLGTEGILTKVHVELGRYDATENQVAKQSRRARLGAGDSAVSPDEPYALVEHDAAPASDRERKEPSPVPFEQAD